MFVHHLLWANTCVLIGYFHWAPLISSFPRSLFSPSLIFHLSIILLISVLWLANDRLSSHLSFLFFFNPRLIFNVPFLLLLLYLLFFTFTLGLFSYLPFTITYFSIHWLLAINSSALLLDPSSSPFLTFFIRYWIWLIDTSTLRVFISYLYSFLRCLFHGAAKAVPHLPLILSSLWLILHSSVLFFPLGVHQCWCW